ncbi:MAG TPA: hypothetical protein VFR94_16140 [Nitrososphaeraceae archaeon]|nr:hypothetical protein [Nitrososphaeraceae archaeon]
MIDIKEGPRGVWQKNPQRKDSHIKGRPLSPLSEWHYKKLFSGSSVQSSFGGDKIRAHIATRNYTSLSGSVAKNILGGYCRLFGFRNYVIK